MSEREEVVEWIEGLKAAPAEVVFRALDAIKELVDSGGFGAVTIHIVGGKPRQVELKQTYQGNS